MPRRLTDILTCPECQRWVGAISAKVRADAAGGQAAYSQCHDAAAPPSIGMSRATASTSDASAYGSHFGSNRQTRENTRPLAIAPRRLSEGHGLRTAFKFFLTRHGPENRTGKRSRRCRGPCCTFLMQLSTSPASLQRTMAEVGTMVATF